MTPERFYVASVTGYAEVGDRRAATIFYVLDRAFCHRVISRHFTEKAAHRKVRSCLRQTEWMTPRVCPVCEREFVPGFDFRKGGSIPLYCGKACGALAWARKKAKVKRPTPPATLRAWRRNRDSTGTFRKGTP